MDVQLYADSAPNAYGSPNYAPWRAQAFSDVVAGTFTDMRNGAYPGTHIFAPTDAIVSSVGDLGKRLTWIYWIPNMTVAQLSGMNFQVKTVMDWDGIAYTYDWNTGATVADAANLGWIQPGSWINYNNGVIGAFGNAWWAVHGTDPEAADYYTGVTQADIDSLGNEIQTYQTYWTGQVRYLDNGIYQTADLKLDVVPEPTTMIAGALLLLPFGASTLRILRKRHTA
jgi:hypothetical protein